FNAVIRRSTTAAPIEAMAATASFRTSMMESLNRTMSASTAFAPPILATPEPAWARTVQYSSPQAPISASNVAGSASSARALDASSLVASSTSSSASNRSSSVWAIGTAPLLLILVITLTAVWKGPAAADDQSLGSSPLHALVE